MQGEGDAGTVQHAPWATSVEHGARIVREAAPRSGRGRVCLGTLPQPGTTDRALIFFRSERAMLAARRPTRAAHGDGRCPSDLRPRLRRIPNTSCSVRHDPWCTATARSWTAIRLPAVRVKGKPVRGSQNSDWRTPGDCHPSRHASAALGVRQTLSDCGEHNGITKSRLSDGGQRTRAKVLIGR